MEDLAMAAEKKAEKKPATRQFGGRQEEGAGGGAGQDREGLWQGLGDEAGQRLAAGGDTESAHQRGGAAGGAGGVKSIAA